MDKRLMTIGAAAFVAAAAGTCGAIDLAKEFWQVPNWTTIVTEPGAIQEQYGRTKNWCGHVQGMCVSSNAIYFSFHDQIVKTDWFGRLLNRTPVDPHSGDICIWNGKLYTGVWLKPKTKGEKWCGAIGVYDAETLEHIKTQKVESLNAGVDGIAGVDDLDVGVGRWHGRGAYHIPPRRATRGCAGGGVGLECRAVPGTTP